ncbi:MAG: hypothetical protein LUD07_10860 [Clostridiales bacterium]|nr:hypothetical protein [Clostridiales bacterium]
MRKQMKMGMRVVATSAMMAVLSICAYAAPNVMPDGQTFDAEYYAAVNPDVAAAIGTDEAALYNHYVQFGKAEGRLAYEGDTGNTESASENSENTAEEAENNTGSVITVTDEFLQNAAATHSYYKYLTAEQAAQADAVAKGIAESILSNPDYDTDLAKVRAAAIAVLSYTRKGVYGNDAARYYRSPYGVFISGNYTCAGTARATGRILDYMGYTWQHVNENQYQHQWCVLTMDGQTGFADGMAGLAMYGDGWASGDSITIELENGATATWSLAS